MNAEIKKLERQNKRAFKVIIANAARLKELRKK